MGSKDENSEPSLKKRIISPSYSSSPDISDQQDLCSARISGCPPVFRRLGPPYASDTINSSGIYFISSLSGYCLAIECIHTHINTLLLSFCVVPWCKNTKKKYCKRRLYKIAWGEGCGGGFPQLVEISRSRVCEKKARKGRP
jgi:hypothetical protein